ncbi:cyclic nucleotide-binding domain-containing protein [Chloroflexus aggregans]|uniref:Cyclic nucleotide-binding protein n=1 Tax=Chloroflexus aggregans (strain MD-66 / DSM 9485) TaxID=326427 RepID=B8GD83_CHLAD|nr:cyclic nucleotide-binding domain-containing protein [Chloroflexus aggregans]ACL25150.1 cyclic nucleotide-binding protein [Chloroflexus aggregans DSM 9485]
MSSLKHPMRHRHDQGRSAHREQRQQQAIAALAALDCLRGVSTTELTTLYERGVFRVFPSGATVIGQRRGYRYLFFLLRGSLQLRLRDKDGHEVLMGVLGQGDCFGEGPLFGKFFRHMSALTQDTCYLLQIDISTLREELAALPLLTTALRKVYRRRMVEATLARIPILSQLLPIERIAIATRLQPRHVPRGTVIVKQGEPADSLYLIENGQVVIEQSGQTIATLGEGDLFGEISLLTGEPHRATTRALTTTDLLELPGAEFYRLINQYPALETELRAIAERRLKHSAAVRSNAARARDIELAVHRGILRATHILVRDPARCPPGCRLCETGCASRHGHSRLHLNGTPIERFDVLDSCRQCSVGAECVEACPEDAIERVDTGALRITNRCTGCGECVTACPYDAVQTVPRAKYQTGPLWDLFRRWQQRIRPTIPLATSVPTHRADKCDLCFGYTDLACISACPIGNLRLAPVEEIVQV